MQQAGGEREALLPAAGERSCELVAALEEAEPVERRVDAGDAVRHPVHARDEGQVLADREVLPEREPLRHVAGAALDLPRLRLDVEAQASALAGIRREQPAEHADRRRLAAAVRPEEAEDLAAPHRQREVAHDVVLAEVLVQAPHVDDEVGSAFGRPCGTHWSTFALRAVFALGAALRAHGSVTSTGWPGFSFAASPGEGLASTRNTSLPRFSFE